MTRGHAEGTLQGHRGTLQGKGSNLQSKEAPCRGIEAPSRGTEAPSKWPKAVSLVNISWEFAYKQREFPSVTNGKSPGRDCVSQNQIGVHIWKSHPLINLWPCTELSHVINCTRYAIAVELGSILCNPGVFQGRMRLSHLPLVTGCLMLHYLVTLLHRCDGSLHW